LNSEPPLKGSLDDRLHSLALVKLNYTIIRAIAAELAHQLVQVRQYFLLRLPLLFAKIDKESFELLSADLVALILV